MSNNNILYSIVYMILMLISIDFPLFQYGYAPKGTSVVLYRRPEYRHHQYTVTTEWPGGVYGSPTVNGEES